MKVSNFGEFMKSQKKRVNESEEMMSANYGANPEAEMEEMDEIEGEEAEEGEEEDEVTIEDLKAMVEDLEERVRALEGGEEAEEEA